MCMTDLFHFLEQGLMLEQLTSSAFVKDSLNLLLNWQTYPFLSLRIFKRIATFLKKLTSDNEHSKVLASSELDSLVANLVDSLFIENADFACSMLAFNFNVHIQRDG